MTDTAALLSLMFHDAIEIATKAKTEFLAEPMTPAKRGSPRASSWFPVWRDSVQNAVRLAHELGAKAKPKSFDQELQALLRKEEP